MQPSKQAKCFRLAECFLLLVVVVGWCSAIQILLVSTRLDSSIYYSLYQTRYCTAYYSVYNNFAVHYTILYYTILYYTILYYTILYMYIYIYICTDIFFTTDFNILDTTML